MKIDNIELCDVCCEPLSECKCTDSDFTEAYGEYCQEKGNIQDEN